MTSVHFKSESVEWGTPPEILHLVKQEYPLIDLDVCATTGMEKFDRYFSPYHDGLKQPWFAATRTGYVWMNPPYGRVIGLWIAKAALEATAGVTTVALLPARTDTRWWHQYVEPIRLGKLPGEVVFLRGRLSFVRVTGERLNPAPFPSCLVVFGAHK